MLQGRHFQSRYYTAGKPGLAGDTARAVTAGKVLDLRRKASALKEYVAKLTLENRLPKEACSRLGAVANEVSRLR